MNNLELRDIHLPNDCWTCDLPAIGFWCILLLACIVLAYAIRYFMKRRLHRAACHAIEKNFQQFQQSKDTSLFFQSINRILKRMACHYNADAAHMNGVEWLQFLDSTGKTSVFSHELAAFSEAPYATQMTLDAERVKVQALQWIRRQPLC